MRLSLRSPSPPMVQTPTPAKTRFHVEFIKPSHRYDDGYLIQWRKPRIPSYSLATLYGPSIQAAQNKVTGTVRRTEPR
jgi:hypothetical protein